MNWKPWVLALAAFIALPAIATPAIAKKAPQAAAQSTHQKPATSSRSGSSKAKNSGHKTAQSKPKPKPKPRTASGKKAAPKYASSQSAKKQAAAKASKSQAAKAAAARKQAAAKAAARKQAAKTSAHKQTAAKSSAHRQTTAHKQASGSGRATAQKTHAVSAKSKSANVAKTAPKKSGGTAVAPRKTTPVASRAPATRTTAWKPSKRTPVDLAHVQHPTTFTPAGQRHGMSNEPSVVRFVPVDGGAAPAEPAPLPPTRVTVPVVASTPAPVPPTRVTVPVVASTPAPVPPTRVTVPVVASTPAPVPPTRVTVPTVASTPAPVPENTPSTPAPPVRATPSSVSSSPRAVAMSPATGRVDRVALANTAWAVLKQSLSDESASGKFNDFREGAGSASLKSLDSASYMALMRELSESADAAVRRRVMATMSDINNVGASRILKQGLADSALPVRMEAAAILGSRGDQSVIAVYRSAGARGHDDRFLVLSSMKRVNQKWMVSLLRPFLRDSDPFMRVAAAEGLARLGDEQAYMLLRKSMGNSNKYLRSSAYAAVQDVGGKRSLPMLLKALNDKDPAIRLYAAVYLAKSGNPSGIHVLQTTLRDSNPALRFTAVDALAQLDTEVALQTLVRALTDTDPEVRVRAAAGLLAHKKGNGVAVIEQALRSDQVSVRLKAVEAAKLGCPGPGLGLLQCALTDSTRAVRVAAIEGLSLVAEVRDRDTLVQGLSDRETGVRVASAIVLVRLDDGSGEKAMARFVAPGSPERDEVLRTMEKLKVPAMAPYLKALATSGASDDNARAVQVLGLQDSAPAAEALCAIAKTAGDETMRLAAVQALGRIQGDLSSYLLKSLLRDDVPQAVQLEAASILGDRGVEAAGPVLRRAADANNVKAARALCKIGDPAGTDVYQQMLGSSDLQERIEAAVVLFKLKSRAPVGVD